MNCETAKKLLPGWILDELDVEPRREVERHAADCAACRAEAESLRRAQAALAGMPEVETSAARRGDVVSAMKSAHGELLERALVAPRRRLRGWSFTAAAAAALMGIVGWAAGSSLLGGPVYRVASAGGGMVLRSSGAVALAPGMTVRRGDRLYVRDSVRLEGREGTFDLEAGARMTLTPDGLLLEDGSLRVELRGGTLSVTDLSNDSILLRPGRFELKAEEKRGVVGSDPKAPLKTESAYRLQARVLQGSARLAGPNGELELRAGERGELDVKGYPTRP